VIERPTVQEAWDHTRNNLRSPRTKTNGSHTDAKICECCYIGSSY